MLVYGKCECFGMHMLYACFLCTSCGSPQCCVLHDLFVNAGRGCKRFKTTPPISGGGVTAVLAHCCANCVETSRHSNGEGGGLTTPVCMW